MSDPDRTVAQTSLPWQVTAAPPVSPAPPADPLRRRLRVLAGLQTVNAATFAPAVFLRMDPQFALEVIGPVGLTAGTLFAVVNLVAIVALTVRRDWSDRSLRRLDAAALLLLAVALVAWHHNRLLAGLELPSEGPAHRQLLLDAGNAHANLIWFICLLTYGVAVPGPTRWQAVRMVALATAAVGAVLLAGLTAADLRPRWPFLLTATASTVYSAAAVVVYGTYRVNALSAEVSAAKKELAELGQYRLGRPLGAGGMGEVFLAEHRFLKRACALKRIRPEKAADPAYARRFEREVAAVTRLAHPAAVQVYDYGRTDDGTLYYVMEYLPGLTLEEVVKRTGPLPAGRVVHLLRQVCEALAEAHTLGLTHRDVKPANVMLGRFGGRPDAAKLLDFGLVMESNSAETKLTAAGGLLGTPAYMSPEQARGAEVGPAADLYAVGGVGYFLLTGRPPFEAEHPLALLHAHQSLAVVPPSARVPGVPADLEAVLLKLLAKEPADRFPNAAAVAEALAGCQAANEWTPAMAAAWWVRNDQFTPMPHQ